MKQLNFPVKIHNIREDIWNTLWNNQSFQANTFATEFLQQPAKPASCDTLSKHFISEGFKPLQKKKRA